MKFKIFSVDLKFLARLSRRAQYYKNRENMTPEDISQFRERLRQYNRRRYAQMSEAERERYLAKNRERGRIRKAQIAGMQL